MEKNRNGSSGGRYDTALLWALLLLPITIPFALFWRSGGPADDDD